MQGKTGIDRCPCIRSMASQSALHACVMRNALAGHAVGGCDWVGDRSTMALGMASLVGGAR